MSSRSPDSQPASGRPTRRPTLMALHFVSLHCTRDRDIVLPAFNVLTERNTTNFRIENILAREKSRIEHHGAFGNAEEENEDIAFHVSFVNKARFCGTSVFNRIYALNFAAIEITVRLDTHKNFRKLVKS